MRGRLICMGETTIKIEMPKFDETSGNWLSLDFTHTVDSRPTDHPRELLNSYSDLVAWGLYMNLLTDDKAQHILEEAAHHPAKSSEVFQRAIGLREAIYRAFSEVAGGSSPPQAALCTLNTIPAADMS